MTSTMLLVLAGVAAVVFGVGLFVMAEGAWYGTVLMLVASVGGGMALGTRRRMQRSVR